jgi:pimeloyl-ACP methyl ester carboxylesterase
MTQAKYANVNGLNMYYEIHGAGQPLVLLHGAFSAIGTSIVRPEHAVEMFRLLGGGVFGDIAGLPNSQLAVLPGTTHVTLVYRADLLLSIIPPFLDAPMPEAE